MKTKYERFNHERKVCDWIDENINLCEILKEHKGEIFWSDVFDLVTLIPIEE